ncbi:MAG TPA: VWA domain-containing protein [Vicinamibacterales bacterium]|nr:VWA domain-containing protein [Vicinamibacterales bacterium]
MRTSAAIVAGLFVISGAAAGAQQSNPPVFRSGVDLVRFDLSVVDANGRPVTDIRPDEIQIVQDGHVLPIVLFQHVREPAGRYKDAAVRAVSAEVTNNEATPRGHLYIFIFDQRHIAPGNEQAARRAAEAFIRTRVRPSDRVAVYGLPGPGPDLSFTADPSRAIAELQKVRGSLDRTVDSPLGQMTLQEAYQIAAGDETLAGQVMNRMAGEQIGDVGKSKASTALNTGGGGVGQQTGADDYRTTLRILTENARGIVQQTDTDTRDFLQRLSDLMTQFRPIEGRKTVVLLSEGFHDDNVSRELQDVEASAAEAYCVFNALDLNRRGADPSQAAAPTTVRSTEIQTSTAPLASLAVETDGVFVNDASAQIDKALDRIADQAQDYYIAGFVPSKAALDNRGAYQRVSVRVKRPGTHVSARTGYAVPRATAPLDRRRAIDAALGAPFVQQALDVNYTTYELRSEQSGNPRVVLSLDADLPLRAVSDDTHARADVVFVVRDVHDGRVAASGTDTMPLPTKPLAGSALGRSTYRVQFDVPPGSYLMRAVVREPGGLVGSADRRFDVRSIDGPAVTASDVVLGSAAGALPVRATAYTDSGLSGVLEVYGRTPDQLSNVTVQVALAGPDAAGAKTFDADLTPAEASSHGAIRHATFTMPLEGVQPGPYVATVHVRAGGEAVADLTRQVDIVAGAAPAAAATTEPAAAPDPRDVAQGEIFKRATADWTGSNSPAAAHATRGFDLFARGQFPDAAAELQQAFDANSKSAATGFVLGWAWEAAGDHRKAIGAWRAAAVADPTLVPVHLALADVYERLSDGALAMQVLRAGLAAVPNSVELKARLAEISGGR